MKGGLDAKTRRSGAGHSLRPGPHVVCHGVVYSHLSGDHDGTQQAHHGSTYGSRLVAGFAERAGQPVRFVPFLLLAFPIMLLSILISTVYVYLRYL